MTNPLVEFCNDFSLSPSKYGTGKFYRARNIFFRVEAPLSTYFCLGDGLSHRVYALLMQSHHGKQAEPLVSYDNDTSIEPSLSKNKCFSTSPSSIFRNSQQRIYERLSNPQIRDATLIIGGREYDLNKREKRPRLWTINFQLTGDTLHTTAIFGHCSLYPFFSYDILAVKIIAETMHKLLKTKHSVESFFVHSLTNRAPKIPANPTNVFTKLLPRSDVFELIDLEMQIRVDKKLMKPIPAVALQAESAMLLDDIFAYWESKRGT